LIDCLLIHLSTLSYLELLIVLFVLAYLIYLTCLICFTYRYFFYKNKTNINIKIKIKIKSSNQIKIDINTNINIINYSMKTLKIIIFSASPLTFSLISIFLYSFLRHSTLSYNSKPKTHPKPQRLSTSTTKPYFTFKKCLKVNGIFTILKTWGAIPRAKYSKCQTTTKYPPVRLPQATSKMARRE